MTVQARTRFKSREVESVFSSDLDLVYLSLVLTIRAAYKH